MMLTIMTNQIVRLVLGSTGPTDYGNAISLISYKSIDAYRFV